MLNERLSNLALNLLLLSPFSAFNKAQRDYIKERDGNKCQGKFIPHVEGGQLEVHHIIPQRYSKTIDPDFDPDQPELAITLCKNAHSEVHPDRKEALKNYHQAKAEGRSSFDEMFAEREEKLKRREVYWDTSWDRLMVTRSQIQQQRYLREHPDKKFPK